MHRHHDDGAAAPGLAAAELTPEVRMPAGALASLGAGEKKDAADSAAADGAMQIDAKATAITEIIDTDGTVIDADLAALPVQINDAVRAAESHAKMLWQTAHKVGVLLTQAKALLPHGAWESWLSDNCTVAPRTARAYMALAKRLPELSIEERQRVADLPLREAVRAISTSSTAPARPQVYRLTQDDMARTRQVIETCERSLRGVARDVGLRLLKRDRIKNLREKMLAAVSELERMLAAAP